MQQVKIKNINESYLDKPFVVKGRVKFCEVLRNSKKRKRCSAIIFDNISEIEVVAFASCEKIAEELPKDGVVMIENGYIRKVKKEYKKTKHMYQITLQGNSKVTPIDNDKVNIRDFPLHKYTSGADLKTLSSGMIIDVIGVCTQIDSEKMVNVKQQMFRRANILVDSIPIEVKFFGDKADELYNVGRTLFFHSVKYINFNGSRLYIGDSSSVQFNTLQLSNGMDTKQLQQLETVKTFCQDSTIELPDQKLSTSSIIQSNNNSTIELPDQKLSTSSIIQSNNNSTIELPDQKLSTSSIIQSNNNSTIELPDQKLSTSSIIQSNNNSTIELPDQKLSTSSIIQSNNNSTIELPDQKLSTSSIIQSNNNSTIELPDQKLSTSSIIQSNNNSTIELPDQKLSTSSIIQSNNNSTIELPDQKLSTSSIIQSNNNSTIELPDQKLSTSSVTQSYRISDLVDESIDERPSTSGSTPSNKRKTRYLNVEEVTPKIQKKTEPGEAFSDERFGNMVINFMQLVNNNKLVKQMQILECISNIIKEDEK